MTAVTVLDYLPLEDWTDILSRNVSK